MQSEIDGYRAANARRYAPSSRPAIQVDFLAYLREIARERRAGARAGLAGVPGGGRGHRAVRPAARLA
jgi:hypothetical protein